MSYESRIFVMNRRVIKATEPKFNDYIYAENITTFNMCSMENSFKNLFKKPVDFSITGENDEDLTVDKYGEKVTAAEIAPVIEWLKEKVKTENYRRLKPFLAYLETLNPAEWDELLLVHYGY